MPKKNAAERYFARLAEIAPSVRSTLQPGAEDAALRRLERAIGLPLPEEVRALLRLANGQPAEPELGAIYGLEMLSAEAIADEWKKWKRVRDEGGLEELDEPQEVVKKGTIQPRYTLPGWIPLFRFPGSADYIGVDLEPGPKGKIGQTINFGRDQELKYVAAKDLDGFFALLAGWMEEEGAGPDREAVQTHIEDLFARAGLAMERCMALAQGEQIELEPTPAPTKRKRTPERATAAFEPPKKVAHEARAFLEILDAELAQLGPRVRHAKLDAYRDDGFPGHSGGLKVAARSNGPWHYTSDPRYMSEALWRLFDVAEKAKLPPRIVIEFEREGGTWRRDIKSICS